MRRPSKWLSILLGTVLLLALFPLPASAAAFSMDQTYVDGLQTSSSGTYIAVNITADTEITITTDLVLDKPILFTITEAYTLTIEGNGTQGITPGPANDKGLFLFHNVDGKPPLGKVKINNLNFANQDPSVTSTMKGGAISSKLALKLTDCEFTGLKSELRGGAVYCEEPLTMDGCTFERNAALDFTQGEGGAVWAKTIDATDCVFDGNTAGKNGGAVWAQEDSTFIDCTFTGNSSIVYGGAIYNNKRTLTVKGSTFTGNTAGNDGGAIYHHGYDDGPGANVLWVDENCFFGTGADANTSNGTPGGGTLGEEGNGVSGPSKVFYNTEPPLAPAAQGDPVLPMSFPASFTARRATAMLSMPVDGAPAVRQIGYYYTVNVLRLVENGYVEATYRGQTGYIPLRDLGRSEGLTW